MNGHILSIGLTCLVVAVAWAKKMKFAAVKDEERYEANVDLIGEPTIRDRKKGVAVMMTIYSRCESYDGGGRQSPYRSMEGARRIP